MQRLQHMDIPQQQQLAMRSYCLRASGRGPLGDELRESIEDPLIKEVLEEENASTEITRVVPGQHPAVKPQDHIQISTNPGDCMV